MSLSESDSSFFCYPLEETLATEVVATITQSLNDSSDLLGCSKLVLPDCLLHNISQELLHLAVSEPCGLRGALIDLCVDRGDQRGSLCTVDQIAVDATLVPTFHLTLVLRLESGGLWPKVQKLFNGSRSPQRSAKHQNTLRLSTSFRAIKRKLYCSGELLIEECCWPWLSFLRQYLLAPNGTNKMVWNSTYLSLLVYYKVPLEPPYVSWQLLTWFQVTQKRRLMFLSYECKVTPIKGKAYRMYLIVKYDLKRVFCISNNIKYMNK